MRQNVIFSTLAVAVAPVAAIAGNATYMNQDVVTVTGADPVTVLETSSVKLPTDKTDLINYKVTMKGVSATMPADAKVTIWYGTLKLRELQFSDLVAPNKTAALWDAADDLPAEFPESGAVKVTITLPDGCTDVPTVGSTTLWANISYVKGNILKELQTKAAEYATTIAAKGYATTDEQNADLLLFQDLTDTSGKEERTIENYQTFDIFNGTETIETAFAELQADIEKKQVEDAVEDATGITAEEKAALEEIIADPDASDELKDAAQEILDKKDELDQKQQELDEALNNYTEFDEATNEELQKKADQINALSGYIDWLMTAKDVQAAIDEYAKLLDELETTVGTPLTFGEEDGLYKEGGADLGTEQINDFRNSMMRLAGLKLALAKAKEQAEAGYDAENGTFTEPTNFGDTKLKKDPDTGLDIPYDKNDPVYKDDALGAAAWGPTNVFTDIDEMLGVEIEPAISDEVKDKISVLGNIAFVKGCAAEYEKKTAQVFDDIEKATKDYNERMTLLEAKYAELTNDETLPVDYSFALAQVRDMLYNKIMKGGILRITDELKEAKLTGDAISYTFDYGFTELSPWGVWENELLKVLTTDATSFAQQYIDGWKDNAQDAYDRYKDLYDLVNGDDPATLQSRLDAFEAGFTDEIPADVQAEITKIQGFIDGLNKAMLDAAKTVADINGDDEIDVDDDFAINTDDWDKTIATSKWKTATYGDNDGDAYHSFENIKAKIDALNALQAQLDVLIGLADRLEEAGEILNAKTPAKDVDDKETIFNDPTYTATDFYTAYAGDITNWIAEETADAQIVSKDWAADGVDGDKDKNYADVDDMIKVLEGTAEAPSAVDKYATNRTNIAADKAAIEAIYNKVKDHGVYGAKYKALIDGWNATIKAAEDVIKGQSDPTAAGNRDVELQNLLPMTILRLLPTRKLTSSKCSRPMLRSYTPICMVKMAMTRM